MSHTRITDEADSLISIFPPKLANKLIEINHTDLLIEVVLDLGRTPLARFSNGVEVELSDEEVTRELLDNVISKVGKFDSDNRTGIERTLHRISAIYNRKKEIVGLTCRVGRAVYGMVDIIDDYIMSGKSVLILGRPGTGKTTMLREASRILAENRKRVIVVDSSNEIGGDGDIPHPAIGKARRMQVADPAYQHRVMIEAVENHNPQVIVIDEIGKRDEAAAARTIAERGVQLIATAHGNELENLVKNPTLSDLVGGVETVVLSDDEAMRRGTQKTVMERKSPPTFDVLVEIQTFDSVIVHPDIAESVDCLLRKMPIPIEKRCFDEKGNIVKQKGYLSEDGMVIDEKGDGCPPGLNGKKQSQGKMLPNGTKVLRVFISGVSRKPLTQIASDAGYSVVICKSLRESDVVLLTKASARTNDILVDEAKKMGMPVITIPGNTTSHIRNAVQMMLGG